MKFLALISLAAAAVAIPILPGGVRKFPIGSNFGQQGVKLAKGPGNTKTTVGILPGLTTINHLHIPSKREAAPVPSVLTTGVQGGEVVKRDAKGAVHYTPTETLPLHAVFGKKGVQASSLLSTLPSPAGILKRWFGFGDGEAEAEMEKRQPAGQTGKPFAKNGFKAIDHTQESKGSALQGVKVLGLSLGGVLKE